jgi:glycosyltransferase involved in cell wall biosynthesis
MIQPIRILHIVRPSQGGIRSHLRLLCRELLYFGHSIHIVAPVGFRLEDIPGSISGEISIYFASIRSTPSVISDLRAALKTARLAKEMDVVHAHGLRAGWIGAMACQLCAKPLVLTAHNLCPQPRRDLPSKLLQWALHQCDEVIGVSNSVITSLRSYVSDGSNFRVIPNGVDLQEIDAMIDINSSWTQLGMKFEPQSTMIIATAGRFEPEKGYDHLLHAASLIHPMYPEVTFLLMGDGSEKNRLSGLIPGYGLTQNVLMPGRMRNIPALFAKSQLVVVPSISEGQGITALEAMAARRCVVASDTGGLSETIEDGVTGVLTPPGDPHALADAIVRMITNDELRDRMGKSGRLRVERYYTSKMMTVETESVYQSAISKA